MNSTKYCKYCFEDEHQIIIMETIGKGYSICPICSCIIYNTTDEMKESILTFIEYLQYCVQLMDEIKWITQAKK